MRIPTIANITPNLVIAVCIAFNLAYAGDPVPFDPKPDDHAGIRYAVLTIDNPIIHSGKQFDLDARLVNPTFAKMEKFFNPFFFPPNPCPGELAIFDERKRYIDDLLSPKNKLQEGQFGITDDAYVTIPPRCYIGTTFHGLSMLPLPPGTYYLQIIYYDALSTYEAPGTFDTKEDFRSNRVKITVIK